MRISAIALTALLLLPAVTAHAQVCRGAASFSAGPLAMGGSIELGGPVRRYSANLSLGIANAVFVTGNAGTVTIDAVDASAKLAGGVAGYELPLTRTRRTTLCAVGVVSHESAREGVLRATALTRGGGLSLGGEKVLSPRVAVIPFASVTFFRTRAALEDNVTEYATIHTYWSMTFGLGFVLNGKVTVQPSVRMPFGIEIVDPSFVIATQINLGGGGT